MATTTTNLHLKKPEMTDYVSPQDFNDDMDIIDEQISGLYTYEKIDITVLTLNPPSFEKGTAPGDVVVSWRTNKAPTSLTVAGETVTPPTASGTRTKSYASQLTSDQEIHVLAGDGHVTCDKSQILHAYSGLYYGAAAAGTYNAAFITWLSGKLLRGSKACSFTANAGSGKYIFFCLPTSYGTPTFTVGGFSGGFTKVASSVSVTIGSLATPYDVWKSDNANLGSTTVTVS